MKGQISTTVAIITAGGMILTSAFTGWFSAASRMAELDTKIEVVETRENLHYIELEKSIDRLECKVDKLVDQLLSK